jgi:hypothetical protein
MIDEAAKHGIAICCLIGNNPEGPFGLRCRSRLFPMTEVGLEDMKKALYYLVDHFDIELSLMSASLSLKSAKHANSKRGRYH